MKKFFTLVLTLAFFSFSNASGNLIDPKKSSKIKASNVLIPTGKNGEKVSLMDISEMKIKELENITGNKMTLVDKIGFKIAQQKLRNSISPDGTLDNKRFAKAVAKADGDSGFHLGGFALGLLLGLIGVLIAYLIKDDLKSQRVKWAWIGFAVIVVINLIVFVL